MGGFVVEYATPGDAELETKRETTRETLEAAALFAWHMIWPEREGRALSVTRAGEEVMSEAELIAFAERMTQRDEREANDVLRHAHEILRDMGKL